MSLVIRLSLLDGPINVTTDVLALEWKTTLWPGRGNRRCDILTVKKQERIFRKTRVVLRSRIYRDSYYYYYRKRHNTAVRAVITF